MNKLCLYIMLAVLMVSSASALDYFTDRMNFPPGESRQHIQTLANKGNSTIIINATIPQGFNLSSTNCNQINSTFVSCTIPANSSRYYMMDSPANCTEGGIYKSYLTSQDFSGDFIFVCIPDNKITDCKIEYGHGDANYLPNDQLYISNEPTSIFNLIRVWNIGHYLTPDEAAENATISCSYEKYPVRTYGRVEIDYGDSYVNGSFNWDIIESGYWFRIGVVSQDISGKSVGDYYNKTCTNLTYQFKHHQVIATPSTCNLEIRNKEPFTFSTIPHPTLSGKSILTITNSEKYNVYHISFDKLLNGITHTETYQQLNSGKSISYVIDNSTECNTTIFFIPSWYINSWHPVYYTQTINCTPSAVNNCPILIQNIPDQIWNMNTNNTNAFDLDSYFSDADNDTLTYSYTSVNNIMVVINSTTNQVSFIPDVNFSGIRNITFYANDSKNITPSNIVQLIVLPCGNGVVEAGEQCDGTNLSGQTCAGLGYAGGNLNCTPSCAFNTSACTSAPSPPSGGGGGREVAKPIQKPTEEIPTEPIKDIELTIISYPESINIDDKEFVVFAEVQNKGDVLLKDVKVEIDKDEGWSAETGYIGDLNIGEKKRIELRFKNELCSSGLFVIRSSLRFALTAKNAEVSDSKEYFINIKIPELTAITDKTEYSEGDLMRLCVFYNNIGEEKKEKLEFEINFMYSQEAHYIIDYLSSYSVDKNKILIVTRDYVLENIPETTDYTISIIMYSQGSLFSKKYEAARTSTKILLNGIIEDMILQKENSIYEFRYNNEQHSITINSVNENFVDITIFSSPKNFRIGLLETIKVDLDEDGIDDISATYIGLKEGKADIRIKILPKEPKVPAKATESYEVALEERVLLLEAPTAIAGKDFWKKLKSSFIKYLFRAIILVFSIIIFVVIAEIIFYFLPSTHKFIIKKKDKAVEALKYYKTILNDNFLNIKSILKSKR